MPIYEYQSNSSGSCSLCKSAFEIRQSINDPPIHECPKCGKPVQRLFSRNFMSASDPISGEDTYQYYTAEEADTLGLGGGFAGDQVWE